MNRREFIETGVKGVLSASLVSNMANAAKIKTGGSDKLGSIMPTRPLGETGEQLTLLAVGGAHVARMDDRTIQEVVDVALEEGIRFFDTAHSYGNGKSEEHYGNYLCPKYRENVFIMTKSTATTAEKFQEQFDLSLKRLKTDYVDLVYIHSLQSIEDVDARQKNGVFDKVRELQAQGKARHLGVSCHTHATIARYFLEKTRNDEFICCFQTPVNSVDAGAPGNSFTQQVVPQVVARGHSHIAMKTLAGGALAGGHMYNRESPDDYPIPEIISIEENFQFVLSQPVTAWVSGMESVDHVRQNAKIAKGFSKLSMEDKTRIVEKVAANQYYRDSRMEAYKLVT